MKTIFPHSPPSSFFNKLLSGSSNRYSEGGYCKIYKGRFVLLMYCCRGDRAIQKYATCITFFLCFLFELILEEIMLFESSVITLIRQPLLVYNIISCFKIMIIFLLHIYRVPHCSSACVQRCIYERHNGMQR